MSEPNTNPDEPKAPDAVDDGAAAGDIPVEVVPPDPAATPTAADDLEVKLAAVEKEKKDNWDRYLRAAADLENLRKRQKREIEDAKVEAKTKVLKEMLPVVDNLERAIEHATAQSGQSPIIEGVQLVLRQFTTAFERLDVVPVEALNQPFDPNVHEAISQMESAQPPGTVVQVLQRGYRIGVAPNERLLRPALVVVASNKPPAPAAKAES